jgi:hypothetical protein
MPIVCDSLKVSRSCLRVPCNTDSMRCAALIHSTSGTELRNGSVNENFRGPKFSFGRFLGSHVWDSWHSSLLPCSGGMGHASYLGLVLTCPQDSMSERQS